MNNAKPPLDDVKVRQAIAHAIDRQAIIDGAMFGYGTPIGTFMSPANPNYVDLTAQSAYDPEKSKALLAEAGVTDLTLTMKLPPSRAMPVAVVRSSPSSWQPSASRPKSPTSNGRSGWARCSPTRTSTSPSSRTPSRTTSASSPGRTTISATRTPTSTRSSRTSRWSSDPAKRTELYKAAQQNLSDNYVVGFLFELAKVGVENAKLKGMWENAPTQATDLTAVYWEE